LSNIVKKLGITKKLDLTKMLFWLSGDMK
jgi:hypothetical protein